MKKVYIEQLAEKLTHKFCPDRNNDQEAVQFVLCTHCMCS